MESQTLGEARAAVLPDGAGTGAARVRELEGRLARLRELLSVTVELNSEHDPDTLLRRIAEVGARAVRADRATIFTLDRQRNELCSRIALGLGDGLAIAIGADQGIAGHVATTGQVVNLADAYEDSRFLRRVDEETGYRTRSLLAVPMRNARAEIIGVIQALNKLAPEAGAGVVGAPPAVFFTAEDAEVLEVLAAQAAIALENARGFREIRAAAERAAGERDRLRGELEQAAAEFIGISKKVREVREIGLRVAKSPVTVLITGESGTGKSHIARLIHLHSERYAGPFVYLNCAAIPETLVESELFGIERGVATGVEKKIGRIEAASGGTMFLDEIGDMSLQVQAKILQVLQEREVVRVGGRKPLPIDVRFVSATNKDLVQEIQDQRFREDLFYRLNVVTLRIPPLRERREDVVPLVFHLLEKVCQEYNRKIPHISREALNALAEYDWPGNVRELDNEVRRFISLAPPGGTIELHHLSDHVRTGLVRRAMGGLAGRGTLEEAVAALEQEMIRSALAAEGGNKVRTAKLLGLSREGLRKKMKRYALE